MRVAAGGIGLWALLFIGSASAQGTIPTGSFGSAEGKARPDTVKEDLIGTPRDIRTVPRAPTLPDLTHRAPELSGEQTIASITPRVSTVPSDRESSRLTSHLFHFDYEMPIVPWLYAGAEWGFAAARAPDVSGTKFVAGQPQLFARAVHSFSHERYSVGAGLGVIPPVFSYDDKSDQQRLEGATPSSLVGVVRPWDLSTFLDRRLTLRPSIDLRVRWRKFVLQLRQGVDVNFRTSASPCGTGACDQSGDLQLLSATTLYLGWQPTREMALGLEAWEVFMLKSRQAIADRDRSVLALSPSIRFYYRYVEPAVSVLFPIGSPLMNAADGYFALRIDMRVWFGAH